MKNNESDSVDKFKLLAQQLRTPLGEHGVQVGNMMHESNIGMTLNCFASLDVGHDETVLEIGHGNAAHLSQLFQLVPEFKYLGVDVSETMNTEASKLNAEYVQNGKAEFLLQDASSVKLPIAPASIHHVMTVNTIYFLDKLADFFTEIAESLILGGTLAVAFVNRSSMLNLPFTKSGFEMYEPNDVVRILISSGFQLKECREFSESVMNKSDPDAIIERTYSVITARIS